MNPVGRPSIYTLSDSTGVRYVGQSCNVAKRYKQHCSLTQNQGSTHRQTWLRSLLEAGEVPALNVLFETDNPNLAEKEQVAQHLSIGCNLVNGNAGGIDLSHAIRAKKTKPWGNTHSPVQRRLKNFRETVRTLIKLGFPDRAENVRLKYENSLRVIRTVGLDEMNVRLWNKYGC